MRILLAIALCFSGPAFASQAADKAETFLAEVTAGDPAKAIDNLFAGSGILALKPQSVEFMKTQTRAAIEAYGKVLGVEKIHEESLTPSLKRLVYLQKFEFCPVIWEMYFYKAKDSWAINSILFNDDVGALVGPKK